MSLEEKFKGVDWTPLLHASITVVIQLVVFFVFGNLWAGALFTIVWWLGREHAQAEARWRASYGKGHAGVTWTGGLDPRVWSVWHVLDILLPVVAATLVYSILI